eukprot:332952-Hanusia_phi.AAC.1
MPGAAPGRGAAGRAHHDCPGPYTACPGLIIGSDLVTGRGRGIGLSLARPRRDSSGPAGPARAAAPDRAESGRRAGRLPAGGGGPDSEAAA